MAEDLTSFLGGLTRLKKLFRVEGYWEFIYEPAKQIADKFNLGLKLFSSVF